MFFFSHKYSNDICVILQVSFSWLVLVPLLGFEFGSIAHVLLIFPALIDWLGMRIIDNSLMLIFSQYCFFRIILIIIGNSLIF